MSYTIDQHGIITCPDGDKIYPPYDSPRYAEYVDWVSAGNNPENVFSSAITEDTIVTTYQAKAALVQMGFYSAVEAYMRSPDAEPLAKLRWEYLDFRRGDPDVVKIGTLLGLDLDHLFTVAKEIYDPKAAV